MSIELLLLSLLLLILSFTSSSFQLKQRNHDIYRKYNSISMQLKDDELIDLLRTTDRGIAAKKEDVTRIDQWIEYKESQYNGNALDDVNLFGYYDVSFVGTGSNQTGNPAGGLFRGKLGQLLYKNEGLYQHVLKTPEKGMGRDITVINVVKGRLLHFFVLYVILDGFCKPLLLDERQRLTKKYGNRLSEGTVKALFLPPLLGLGLYTNSDKLVSFRVGPKSDVVLDTIYLDESFRLGRGSRGSTFIFRRLGELDQNLYNYKKVMENKTLSGKVLGILLAAVGLSIIKIATSNLIRGFRISLDRILISFLKIGMVIPGISILLLGAFLLFSKGGIIEENFS